MTKFYKVSRVVSKVQVGDVLESPFNDFRVIEVHKYGVHYYDIRVEQMNTGEKYYWRFKWDDRVMVKELA